MRRTTFILMTVILFLAHASASLFAQSPEGFSYQAVIRDANGNTITNTPVSLRMTIYEGAPGGQIIVYQESNTVTSNSLGLINTVVGQGSVLLGTYNIIDWANDDHFLQVEVDPAGGTNYIDLGTTKLWSVPYALYGADEDADTTNELQSLSFSGSSLSISKGNSVTIPNYWSLGGSNLSNSVGTRIGIGTPQPNATLDVEGVIHNLGEQFTHIKEGTYFEYNKNSLGASYLLNQKGNGAGGFYFGSVDQADNIKNWLYMDGDGNIGINNTSPDAYLDIVIPDNSPGSSPRVRSNVGGWQIYNAANAFRASFADQSAGGFTGIYGDGISNFPHIALKGGNVGIGNINPTDRLSIQGGNGIISSRRSTGNNAVRGGLIIGTTATGFSDQWAGILSWQEGGLDQASLSFYTSFGTRGERMRIAPTGEVSIGINSIAYRLYVNGTAGKPGGGSWTAVSDARLKKNVVVYSDGLQKLLQIKPVSYQYNGLLGCDTDVTYIGVLAQDLKEIAPYMVGTFKQDGQEYYDVDNSAMTYMIINAVKEQQLLIEQLQAENLALKAENSQLQSENNDQNTRLQIIEQLLDINTATVKLEVKK